MSCDAFRVVFNAWQVCRYAGLLSSLESYANTARLKAAALQENDLYSCMCIAFQSLARCLDQSKSPRGPAPCDELRDNIAALCQMVDSLEPDTEMPFRSNLLFLASSVLLKLIIAEHNEDVCEYREIPIPQDSIDFALSLSPPVDFAVGNPTVAAIALNANIRKLRSQ